MRTALSAARIFLFPHHNKDCWAAFDKIGGASEKKIEQALFFPLGLHYLCTTLDLQRQTETEIEMVNLQ